MTPAINLARKSKVEFSLHQYKHDPKSESYGEEAAIALNIEPERVFKTLLVAINGDQKELAVAVVPVSGKLNLKGVANALKAKKIMMADPLQAQRMTGYLVGGISPLGQKKCLPTLLDASASSQETIYVSAGKRGLEIELSPNDLLQLTGGQLAEIGL
ncbi:Cys-tRNA(Pro) deacylase [Amphritea balenae]|uniref:Cys-tRNA(Pro)/Cys-tRNA(Cys) deacylase n=1 Tax=Amphritea balenae TaxID=452629 RepID=A0A3P1SYF9_9GAMM|nr:Cys-tRNA(Pro) deacylase [Amphritea balenae]RRD01153.1 Cys-tRNA(Pro) deacylase [Amphritea balenae]GGK59481.1 Cys-tRNA(Pro)/Cys-tRNA(Cys) deacylase [Amphritea balenae]